MQFLIVNKRWSLTGEVSQRRDHCSPFGIKSSSYQHASDWQNWVTFLDALMEERYHLTTSTILSLGSLRSAALQHTISSRQKVNELIDCSYNIDMQCTTWLVYRDGQKIQHTSPVVIAFPISWPVVQILSSPYQFWVVRVFGGSCSFECLQNSTSSAVIIIKLLSAQKQKCVRIHVPPGKSNQSN